MTKVTSTLDFTPGGKAINLPTPVSAGDAVPKSYVDGAVQGLSWKNAAQWATAAALPANTYAAGVLTASANGALTIDGNSPAVGDRVLVKNEATGANNGLYVVTAVGSGAAPYVLTRSNDGATAADLEGMAIFVEGGTANASTQWANTNDGAVTLGTTALTFAQVNSSPSYPISVANGGTGQSSATNARGTSGIGQQASAPSGAGSNGVQTITAEGIPTKVKAVIGDGSSTTITIAHNLNTTDVVVQMQDSSGHMVIGDWQASDANHVVFTFNTAPAASAYSVVIIG